MFISLAIALDRAATEEPASDLDLEAEIERFLTGESDGFLLLDALYGSPADEPIPERFRALVRTRCPR